jgi:hypothetical protein
MAGRDWTCNCGRRVDNKRGLGRATQLEWNPYWATTGMSAPSAGHGVSGHPPVAATRGLSALGTHWAVDHDTSMDPLQSAPVTTRVVAKVPIFGSGLENMARSAGLRVVAVDGEASITLRGPDDPPASKGIDVVAAANSATIIVLDMPEPNTWMGVLAFVKELLAARVPDVGDRPAESDIASTCR